MKSTASLKIIIAKQIFDTSMIPNSNFEWGTSVLRSANCEGSGQKRVIDFTKLAIDGLGKVLQTTVSND